ncbi:MAG: 4Fe-4S binding protein, partial [Rhodospirillales bacterium]|nr:4Fe-4S binding protein [Rhodospirillales bacterium]
GKTAPNPVMSTLRYFREEYEEHIKDKKCSSYTCEELVSYYIDPEKCEACLICMKKCTAQSIIGAKHQIHVVDQDICTKCGSCYEVCPDNFDAVLRFTGETVPESIPVDMRTIDRKKKKADKTRALASAGQGA